MRILKVLFLLAGCVLWIVSCKQRKAPAANLYFDYRVWGDEESGEITVRLQYRLGGSDGRPVRVAGAALDGKALTADSTKMSGVYYEVSQPAADFAGAHRIEYIVPGEPVYREEFEFSLISLKTEPAPVTGRADLALEVAGLKKKDRINVLLNDTSFYSRGIDRIDTVDDGRILIGRDDLDNLKDGPVRLELYKEEERPLRNPGGAGGKLSLSFGLEREFELRSKE